ncbi:MAG: glycoside hydrolase family 2 [Prevotella sp.]|nr:glycoside hydrolase family 2 [Prevotella sp.]
MRRTILTTLFLALITLASTSTTPDTSIAGFFPLENSGRQIWSFNPEWRFHLGDVPNAEKADFNDTEWEVVSTPHSVKLMPAEASGCRNYQGIAWYRKSFVLPKNTGNQNVELHFEAIMGKQRIYIDGRLVKEHEGGYLPITVNLTQLGIRPGEKHIIAVMTDNSNDKTFPPGKPQYTLDFAYHGGIYRDVWLIAKNKVAITDAIEENEVAGGGIFVHYGTISQQLAEVFVNTEVRNTDQKTRTITVENSIGAVRKTSKVTLAAGACKTVVQKLIIKHPSLWSPETPYLYRLATRILEGKTALDGGITRIGIRSFEFRGAEGFFLNGEKYHQFIGANRHQDFAYVGNAVPNSQQWRDAKRLRDAGFTIIRTAHYPQDPSFMDACDELGLFIIVATPGWQYWNKDPQWGEKVHQNTRDIIRRDRNHPCVLMWEPILNETRYPEDFALKALQITHEEYPYPYRPVAAADLHSAGVRDHYDVVYGWPGDDFKADKPTQCIFTREFGEYVDDWYAHNNLNRASRSWGERPQLVQAQSLAKTTDELHHTTGQFIGGCQWHPFDHQRGYHPDPYWGGIYDAFRQKKTAFWMFASQENHEPMVHIAHEMTQFSDADVIVYSNCDSVRLSIYNGEKSWTLPVKHEEGRMPSQPVIFKDVWDFWEARNYSYTQKNWQKVNMVAEGICAGKVVCSEKKMPSRRSTKLRLYIDEMGKKLVADGSDFVVVVCEVTDDSGHVRRLAKENIVFTVEGEGEIIGDASINANPRTVEWGSAPVLIRSTRKPGKIKVHAEVQFPGTHAPTPADIEFESIPASIEQLFIPQQKKTVSAVTRQQGSQQDFTEEEKSKMLQEVEQQQADFGIGQ